MKTSLVAALAVTAAIFSPAGFAAGDHDHAGHDMAKMAATAMVNGTVKKVDKKAGEVVLSHGELTNLGMPAMTMAFLVKNPAWLDQVKSGDKIRFVADMVNGAVTVVQFEPAK